MRISKNGPNAADVAGRRYGNADARTFSRRALLSGMLFATMLSLPFARRLSQPYFTLLDKLGSPEANELFTEMFGRSSRQRSASLMLGRSDYRAVLHPDNFAAGAALQGPLGFLSFRREPRDLLDAAARDELAVVGGTNSNKMTMVAWETTGPNMNQLSRPEQRREAPIIPLRWFGSSDRTSDEVRSLRPVGWKMEGEGYVSTVNWILNDTKTGRPVWAQSSDTPATDRDGNKTHQLTNNHLVVTRLPNYLHPDFLSYSADDRPHMTFFQGMHGLGTRAVELLLTGYGLPALTAAQSAVENTHAYQLLFEVGDVRELPDGRGGELHVCHSIDLVDYDILDQRLDDIAYHNAHNTAQRRLRSSEPWLKEDS
jgi:hypothetical protein